MSMYLTPIHFEVFGRVTNAYATVETAIQMSLSGLLKIPLDEALILTAPYSSSNLKNVAKSLAKLKFKPEIAEVYVELVGRWSAHSKLRNNIAHNRWTKGDRPHSIRPVFVNVWDGKVKFGGYGENERDWTIDEIGEAFNQLADLNEDFKAFLNETGLDAIIHEMIDDDGSQAGDDIDH